MIELMVALSLGMIIILAVTEVATNNSRTRAELERNTRQLESAAYALRMLEGDIRSAGFWGELSVREAQLAATPVAAIPPLCPGLGIDEIVAADELRNAMTFPIQGVATATAGLCVNAKPGSGVLAVRRASSCRHADANCPTASDRFYLQINACLDSGQSTAPMPGAISLHTDPNELSFTSRLCDSAINAPRYRYLSRVYYLNNRDELVRAELTTIPATSYYATTLVEGVEAMRIEYGIDADADGHVDGRTSAPAASQWGDVGMVKVSLVVRNLSSSFGYIDNNTYNIAGSSYSVPTAYRNHKRHVYSRTVSVRNSAGTREVQ